MKPTATRMYRHGPIRMFSEQRFLGGTPYCGGMFTGYVGMFVCAQCRLEVPRVLYAPGYGDWVCRGCDSAWRRATASLSAASVGIEVLRQRRKETDWGKL